MSRSTRFGFAALAAALVLMTGLLTARAADEPTTKPSDSAPADKAEARAARGGRWGIAPYNKLSSVSDEQKRQINEIHRKAVAEIKAIQEKERADIMALLTDEQKAELEKMADEQRAKEKARAADRKAKAADQDDEHDKDK